MSRIETNRRRASDQSPNTKRQLCRNLRSRAQRTEATTLDLRGQRFEEALSRVDGFIDRLLGINEVAGFVLHGHGTGALKSGVREHLRASTYVEHSRPAEPDEGGDAFTVFWLRG